MRALVWIGALLIAVGFVGVTVRVLARLTSAESAYAYEDRAVPIPELAGVMAMLTGVCLVVLGSQSKR